MLALPDQPLATEVREHLKYTDEQWDRFNVGSHNLLTSTINIRLGDHS
jgi:hypothetical protein